MHCAVHCCHSFSIFFTSDINYRMLLDARVNAHRSQCLKPRTGNFCSAELQAEVTDVINLLKQLRSQPELCWRLRRCGSRWPVRVERPQRSHPRSRSQPESEANVESEAEIDDLKREAVSECQVDTDLPLASLEDLKDDAKHCETRRAVRENGVEAGEIILGSPAPPSLLIRQMILDQMQHLQHLQHHDMDRSLIPSPNLSATEQTEQLQVERSADVVLEEGRIDHCFEGLPLTANDANTESCEGSPEFEMRDMQRDMQRGAMAKIPWNEFFEAKINEMCQGFLEQSSHPAGSALGRSERLLSQQDSRLDAMHREALESLQSRLLGTQ